MPCFFCDGFYHLSQNCDKYESNESRQNFAKSINCCSNCFSLTDGQLPCKYCKFYRKCYICFSNLHHVFLCRHRKMVSPFFIPIIDEDLVPRFIQFLSLEEQYSLAFSSPLVQKFVKLKHLSRLYRNNKMLVEKSNMTNFVITESYNFTFDYPDKKGSYPNSSKKKEPSSLDPSFQSIIFRCKQICILNGELTAQEFMQLFSVQLINCYFCGTKILSPVTLKSIIKAAPSMECIRFYKTNIIIENSWPDNILKWNNGNGIGNLSIPIQDFNFDVRSLAAVIKEKSKPSLYISLDITKTFNDDPIKSLYNYEEIVQDVEKRMLPYFCPYSVRPSWAPWDKTMNIDFAIKSDNNTSKILKYWETSTCGGNSNLQMKKPLERLLRYLSLTKQKTPQRTLPPSLQQVKLKSIVLNIKR